MSIAVNKFRPLLAATCDDSNFDQLKYPLLASPKLDGIRCLVVDGKLYSRSMKLIRNKSLQQLTDWNQYSGLDGELILGDPTAKNVFRDTTSAVMSEGGTSIGMKFWVFDNFLANAPFDSRYHALGNYVGLIGDDPLVRVPHILVQSAEDLEFYESETLALGYEGVMLRSLQGKYKNGRSTFKEGILMKLKRGQLRNGDAEIIGFTERMHNENAAKINELGFQKRSSEKSGMVPRGDLGSLRVRDVDSGFEFSIGTGVGLNDALRTEIWQNQKDFLGKIVRYEWFAYGNYDKPRFPKLVCFRDSEDL